MEIDIKNLRLTTDTQATCVKAKNFNFKHFNLLFEGKDQIQISRLNVINNFQDSIKKGILSAFAWGFPTGGRSKAKYISEYLEDIEQIIIEMISHGVTASNFKSINSFKNLITATTTKLLYFSGSKIDKLNSLIFDSRVKSFLDTNRPIEYASMFDYLDKKNINGIPFEAYSTYVKETNALAQMYKVEASVIELYFFENDPKRKKLIESYSFGG